MRQAIGQLPLERKPMFIRTLKLILVLVVLAGLFPGGGQAAQKAEQTTEQTSEKTTDQTPELMTVETIGTATVLQADAAKARERAIENGLAAAVHQAVQELLPQEARINLFERLNQEVYLHPQQLIQDYRVIAEVSRDGVYRALIQARLSAALVEQQLKSSGLIGVPQTLPGVLLVMAAEGSLPQADPSAVEAYRKQALGILADIFQEHSYPLVQPGNREAVGNPSGLDLRHALAMARRRGADVLVMGRLTIESGPISTGGSVQSAQGRVELNAYAAEAGNRLASVSRLEVAPHYNDLPGADKVVVDASSLAARELVDKLSAAWKVNSQKARTFEVVVEGAPQMLAFVGFRRGLSTFPRVQSVQTREMQIDKSVLTVAYRGSAQELAQALDGKTFDACQVEISEFTPSQLKVRLLPP